MEPDLPSDDDGLPELREELPEVKEKRRVKRPRKRTHFDGPRMEELMKVEVVPHRMPDLWFAAPLPAQLDGTIQDDFLEVYSPPRLVPLAVKRNMRASVSMDLLTGWNFLSMDAKISAVQDIKARRPKVIMLSPPCTMFSGLMNLNWAKLEPGRRETSLLNGTNHLEFSMLLADLQESAGRGWCFEHPAAARSWKNQAVERMTEPARVAHFDQCMFGLRSKVGKIAMKKSTRFLTNIAQVRTAFHLRRCDKSHIHCSIQGSEGGEKRSVWAQRYPAAMCEELMASFQAYTTASMQVD